MQTLAVIANSLADMDITNPTFLEVLKQIILRKIDTKMPDFLDQIDPTKKHKALKPDPQQLTP
jgi:hypothetical protein